MSSKFEPFKDTERTVEYGYQLAFIMSEIRKSPIHDQPNLQTHYDKIATISKHLKVNVG